MSNPIDPSAPSPGDQVPVLLVHGWGGSFESTWQQSGFTALLEDAGRPVIGVDLLGHGTAPKPHDDDAYADLTTRVIEALPDHPVDAVGFSLGALTLLRTAVEHPHRFRKLVLAGIGANVLGHDDTRASGIIAALEGDLSLDDNLSRLFLQYAEQPDNDPVALAAVLRQPQRVELTADALASVTCPVLLVVGDQDFVFPPDDLVEALPDARAVVLRNVDHFATPEAFGFIDATLEYLDAVPV